VEGLLSETALAGLTAELVRIPSVNPAIAPEEGTGEAAVAAFARDWLAGHGVQAWLEPVIGDRPNLVAETRAGNGPTLVFCAHLDTVGTAGMESPFTPALRDGRLHGRGAYDMKGSAAAVMTAMAVLAREPPPGRVLAALVADEEHASLGAQAFVAAHPADACILTEPSEGDLVLAHKGFAWFEVSVRGRAAHGSRFDLGDSAIENAAAFVAAARRFDREVLRQRTAALVGPASQHVAMVAGGRAGRPTPSVASSASNAARFRGRSWRRWSARSRRWWPAAASRPTWSWCWRGRPWCAIRRRGSPSPPARRCDR